MKYIFMLCMLFFVALPASADEALDRKLFDDVFYNRTLAVEEDLKAGADPQAVVPGYTTPVVITAVHHGNIIMLDILLRHHADIDEEGRSGETALMHAVILNNKKVVTLLLERGAYIDAYDNFHTTPLMLAATMPYNGILKILLGNGADIHATNKKGDTALSIAKKLNQKYGGEHAQTVKILAGHILDDETKDVKGVYQDLKQLNIEM